MSAGGRHGGFAMDLYRSLRAFEDERSAGGSPACSCPYCVGGCLSHDVSYERRHEGDSASLRRFRRQEREAALAGRVQRRGPLARRREKTSVAPSDLRGRRTGRAGGRHRPGTPEGAARQRRGAGLRGRTVGAQRDLDRQPGRRGVSGTVQKAPQGEGAAASLRYRGPSAS